MKPIDSDNNVSLPKTIEDKLNEAEKDYEEGRTHTEGKYLVKSMDLNYEILS